jgi:hypothetical protein
MPKDVNQLAARVVGISKAERRKNPDAVALERLGGLKGGKAREEKLSRERRRQIALMDAVAPKPAPRGPYKRRNSN